MTATQKNHRFAVSITRAPATAGVDTSVLFPKNGTPHHRSDLSPIDEFLLRLEHLNLLAPPPTSFDSTHAQLLLLGSVAAVESYVRAVFRASINSDSIAMANAYKQNVSFGAALHLQKHLLPEAIFERTTFIGKADVWDPMKEVLGVEGAMPSELQVALEGYDRVCQLRHCIVHRFGRLGAQNATRLGMSSHKAFLEQPVVLTYAALQECILTCEVVVRTINNVFFRTLLGRIPAQTWRRQFSRDKRWFGPLFRLFQATRGSRASRSERQVYDECLRELVG